MIQGNDNGKWYGVIMDIKAQKLKTINVRVVELACESHSSMVFRKPGWQYSGTMERRT